MQYKKGDRVRHPKKPDWGMGQVLADSIDRSVWIFFANAGEKAMSLDLVQPETTHNSMVKWCGSLRVRSACWTWTSGGWTRW